MAKVELDMRSAACRNSPQPQVRQPQANNPVSKLLWCRLLSVRTLQFFRNVQAEADFASDCTKSWSSRGCAFRANVAVSKLQAFRDQLHNNLTLDQALASAVRLLIMITTFRLDLNCDAYMQSQSRLRRVLK